MTFAIGIALNEIAHRGVQVSGLSDWIAAVLRADRAGLDFVTIADQALALPGQTPLDATLLAARVGPLTQRIGILPAAPVTQHEPFHLSTAIATLDFVTQGRAGVVPSVPSEAETAALYARTGATLYGVPPVREAIYRDADDAVEAARRLWDSWEDDTIIRDASTGRFVDRERLHYVDFQAEHFFVRGPSIVPRPPQGQPPVAVVWREPADLAWARSQADVLFAPPLPGAPQPGELPLVYADLVVAFDGGATQADFPGQALFAGSAAALVQEVQRLEDAGYAGVRLHPYRLDDDLNRIDLEFLPLLRGAPADDGGSLRLRLGLAEAGNRYRAAIGG